MKSLAGTADSALGAAAGLRRNESEKVAAADLAADDVEQAVAALADAVRQTRDLLAAIGLTAHDLPVTVHSRREPASRQTTVIRVRRDGDADEIVRPAAGVLTLAPSDLTALVDTAGRLRQAVQSRSAQAANRAADARALAEEQRRVAAAATDADRADDRAREDAEATQERAEVRDDAAIDLVDRWRDWLCDPVTVDLLGVSDWSAHPLLGPLLAERTALCGDDPHDAVPLPELDRAPNDATDAARDALTGELERLAAADRENQRQVDDLRDEQTQLRAAHDPDPRQPFWVSATTGVPLWRCVDFAARLGEAERAGIEAALLSSGLLTATIDGSGRLTAADGQLLVSPQGDPVAAPLSSVLTPDPAAPVPAETIVAILARVALEDRGAATWIGRDGSWGNGPLRGRYTMAAARHIGAAARAAARAARLSDIEAELAELAAAATAREQDRRHLLARQQTLRDHRDTAPRSTRLVQARTQVSAAIKQADRSSRAARELRATADHLANAWANSEREHRRACEQFGLPTDEQSLTDIRNRADRAATGCAQVIGGVAEVEKWLRRHTDAVTAAVQATEQRSIAERAASTDWTAWHSEATKLDVLNETMGASAAEVQRQVAETEAALRRTEAESKATAGAVQRQGREAGTASANAASARVHADELRTVLSTQVTTVLDQLAQPGITATAFANPPGHLFTDLSPGTVETDAANLLTGLRRTKSDENTLLRAQQTFEQSISGSYDVSATVAAGIRLFELFDADGRRPLAQAAVEINRQCELGRAALTEREQRVFTDFVLGEVGEELRRRLAQAGALIAAMNTSLKSIQTSHGIGVRLTWKLSDDTGGDIARIKELITTAASVRTLTQDNELTGLLSARVAAEAVSDPTSGYAAHLRSALDYRAWHVVEVIITGPEPGRERRISRRAKLSQGETRFVSYVTLFAAVDAYLSGLENTAMSLRLILLDDAFAKVDEPTIAELLGLLVRLDVDFTMTGHALWGCVPQVPALDIYEICREDGSPAATAHVHWDGRNRHFLRAT